MKIHPPKVTPDASEPFKNALFGRKEFAESMTTLLRNVSENLVIFVNAPWGEGKTTFAQMWRAYLQGQKQEVVYFDAYSADYFEDPFVSFSGEILGLVEKRFSEGKGLLARREFKKTAVEVGKRLVGLTAKVGLRAVTMNALDSAHLKELKEIGSEITSGVSEIAGDVIEKKIENYTEEKDALLVFKKSLAKLAAVVRDEQGFPLTIIVDELDRCRPDFALGLIERIKHLFDVDGVAFVLLVNRDQIEGYIRTIYGETVDAHSYLMKFANLFVDLPIQPSRFRDSHENGRTEYCLQLFSYYGFSARVREQDFFRRSISLLVTHFSLTLREIEKTFAALALYYSSLPANQLTSEFVVAMLSMLKVKKPSLYHELSLGRITIHRFFEVSGIEHIKSREVNIEWIMDLFRFLLMSDADFAKVVKNEDGSQNTRFYGLSSWASQHNLNRTEIIPYLCSRLDRFSLSA